ncbi:ELO family [Trypanosoma melophagium]|uniref:ELO family n=1 Tax=Trypanosoma melophagium TaxID=715481 RepID=UPI00351A6BC7|nr:ELO family [Trypanosoma melophagium]
MGVCVESVHCSGKESLCFFPKLNPFVSWYALIGGDLCYLALVFLLRRWMQSRRPLDVGVPMVIYNIIQIVLSVLMAINLSPYLRNGVFNLNGLFCAHIELWVFIHYCTKYLDMMDTVFMVCRKKDDQLTFLHLYHHTTIGFIWGLLLRNGMGNGTVYFGAWINSAVHFLMYSHYLWTSFGFKNPLKYLLTKIQMFQFGLCILQSILVPFFDNQFTIRWCLLQMVYHTSLLVLFLNFYRGSKRKRNQK